MPYLFWQPKDQSFLDEDNCESDAESEAGKGDLLEPIPQLL